MSFYASTANNKYVNAEDFRPFEREELFCPSCGCKMHYVSAVSNRRAAHFSGKHFPECDIGSASSDNVDPYHYELPENSIQGLFDLILRQGVKQPSPKESTNSKHGAPTGMEHKGTINTIRKLYNFCASADPDTILPDGKRVGDIYFGKRAADEYKKNEKKREDNGIRGLHLMYAQYNGHNDEGTLFFHCPSKANAILRIAVKSNDKNMLSTVHRSLGRDCYALIFADFKHKHCDIESPAQIVPIKKAKG